MSVLTNAASGAAGSATAYTTAILDLLGERSPLTVLRETPAALARAVEGLSEDQLRRPEREGKWSIVQVLQHLADSEIVWAWRLRLVLAHDRPTIHGYDQDRWAERLRYAEADADEALATFATLRRANLRLVAAASPADLARAGVHAERGEESVGQLVRLYAGHDLAHLAQIDRVRAAVG